MGEQPTALDSLLRDPRLWIAAALVAAESTTYFTAATWLPFLLRGANAGYISLVFFLMNAVAVVPTLLVVFRWRFASSVSFYVAAGVVGAAGAVSMLLGMREWIWLGALGVGLGSAMGYQGIIAAIPKLARRETDVAAYAAAVLAIGYGMAFLGPAIGGVIVDWTDRVDWAFGPAVASGVLMIGLGFMAGRFRGDERGSEGRANG
jgi:CP family cyanate transporter-like MFS transporter